MALNLVRNSRVFFTTNLDAFDRVNTTGFTAANTYEIQVLDGFSFSQNSNSETVSLLEAGAQPVRGQRNFNTSLAPVDYTFSTYMRPKNITTAISAEESVLWNALFSDKSISAANTVTVGGTVSTVTYAFNNTTGDGVVTITGTGLTAAGIAVGDVVVIGGISTASPTASLTNLNAAAIVLTSTATSITLSLVNPTTAATTITTPGAGALKLYRSAWAPVLSSYSYVGSGGSDRQQLQKFGMLFIVDQVVYAVDGGALTQATIDFGLDAISTIAWTGQGTQLRQLATAATAVAGTFGGGTITGTYTVKVTDAQYITNKLSTVSLTTINALKNAAGVTQTAAGDIFNVALTGGSITINNNVTFITPANLGVVNTPVTYFTGARSITGTLNAYLRTGGIRDTGELLSDMLNAASATVEPMFGLNIAIGGGTNTTRVQLEMPATVLAIPTVDVQQVVSTAINFTAEGVQFSTTADGNMFDLARTNDIAIRYFA